MKALTWQGKDKVQIDNVDDPEIEDDDNVIVEVFMEP